MKAREFESGRWTVRQVAETGSTNDLAKELPAWDAVVAGRQGGGRGRYGRVFYSAQGGLWLSAVLPIPGRPAKWTGLALAVGWGVLGWLRSLPVPDARLRWPNDLMVGTKKLGGILLEQSLPELCVVGIGLNITNHPGDQEPTLREITTNLVQAVGDAKAFSPEECISPVLQAIQVGWAEMDRSGLDGMVSQLNESWGEAARVAIEPIEGDPLEGRFLGIDEAGALVLRLDDGGGRVFPAHTVHRMREL